jgi:hypothetical protein
MVMTVLYLRTHADSDKIEASRRIHHMRPAARPVSREIGVADIRTRQRHQDDIREQAQEECNTEVDESPLVYVVVFVCTKVAYYCSVVSSRQYENPWSWYVHTCGGEHHDHGKDHNANIASPDDVAAIGLTSNK